MFSSPINLWRNAVVLYDQNKPRQKANKNRLRENFRLPVCSFQLNRSTEFHFALMTLGTPSDSINLTARPTSDRIRRPAICHFCFRFPFVRVNKLMCLHSAAAEAARSLVNVLFALSVSQISERFQKVNKKPNRAARRSWRRKALFGGLIPSHISCEMPFVRRSSTLRFSL